MTQTATKCLGVTRTAKNSDAENYYPMMPGPSFYHEGAKYEDYNDFANPMKVALEARRKKKAVYGFSYVMAKKPFIKVSWMHNTVFF